MTGGGVEEVGAGGGGGGESGSAGGGGGVGGESTLTVLIALASNALVAAAKIVAAVLTGSASMAAEAAHSIADTVNEVLLLTALRTSARPADRMHPLGYGRVRYFWALLAAGSIFVTGALYSAYEGVRALTSASRTLESPIVNYVVLGVSFLLEGTSLVRGLRQTRSEARAHRLSFRRFLVSSDDPTATTVVFEDSAALIGLVLAAAGNVAHQLTGSAAYDGVASILIAVLLAAVALRLGRTNMHLLTGVQADPRMVHAIVSWLGDQPEVEAVVDFLTITLGTDEVLLCARLDVVDDMSAGQLEQAMVRMGEEVRVAFPDIAEVFLEPVPRDDPTVRARVRDRYGDDIATRLVEEAGADPAGG